MPNPSATPPPSDWHDRLIDAALQEVAGDATPPDLSPAILARAESAAAPVTLANKEIVMASPDKKNTLRNWILAASVLVNLGLAGVLFSRGDGEQVVDNRPSDPPATTQPVPVDLSEINIENKKNDNESTLSTVDGEQPGKEFKPTDPLMMMVTPEIVIEDETESLGGRQLAASALHDRRTDDGIATDGALLSAERAPANEYYRGLAPATAAPGKQPANRPSGGVPDPIAYRGNEGQGQSGEAVGDLQYPSFMGDLDVPSRADSFSTQESADHLNGLAYGIEIQQRAENGQQDGAKARGVNKEANSLGELKDRVAPTGTKEVRFTVLSAESIRESLEKRILNEIQPDTWHPDGQGIGPGQGGDQYSRIVDNPFIPALGGNAVSTFSIDVDTASYANVRQYLMESGSVPPPDSVRLEELVNYFHYNYEGPSSDSSEPFATHVEVAGCPWQPAHRLVRIGIAGREVDAAKRPKSNLVFLIDVSGSMDEPNKLPLVVHGMKKLAEQLGENDRVAIVVYASSEGLVLESTSGENQPVIIGSLDRLSAGGSTAGGAGINLAYQIAEDNFIEGGTNRVILCTDGDFNVGTTNTADLERLVEQKAKETKVFLSVIGFGRGNLNDEMMEKITNIGNGNYYYVDGDREAEKVFVRGMTGMLVTIAKDVKIQVEFNPGEVAGYRLLGYENRMLRTEDFNDDTKDAGEIGSGHTVTALYEVVPAGQPVDSPDVDPLKYQVDSLKNEVAKESGELLTLKMRYKEPDADTSVKREWPVKDSGKSFKEADADMQFASAVAGFGMLLRNSPYSGDATFAAMREIAGSSLGDDPNGERSEFVQIVTKALELKGEVVKAASEEQPAVDTDDEGESAETNAPASDYSEAHESNR